MKAIKINYNLLIFIILFILGIKYIAVNTYPFLVADGPWSLSSSYSYYNGINDSSVFAHDFLGNVFTVHIIDFFYSLWFEFFGLNTFSFIKLHYLFIFFTILIWYLISNKLSNKKSLIYLLSFGYILSPYLYGFRPENLAILIFSISLFLIDINFNRVFKIALLSILCILCGLVHHVGGLILLITIVYYIVFYLKDRYLLFVFIVFGIVSSFILTEGEIINYLILPAKIKSEADNHFSSIEFYIIIKYLAYSGVIPLVVLFLFRKSFLLRDIVFLAIIILLFTFSGRSYYFSYIFPVILFMLILKKDNNDFSNLRMKQNKLIITLALSYSFFFLFLIPTFFIFLSPDSSKAWRNVIVKMAKEKSNWEKNKLYFVPSEISLEVVSNKQSRLLYTFMRINDGIQDVSNKVFYISDKDQLNIIKKNFKTSGRKIKIEELVHESKGHIAISTVYKLNICRKPSFGLWKVVYL